MAIVGDIILSISPRLEIDIARETENDLRCLL
jgi:hypothetical protein